MRYPGAAGTAVRVLGNMWTTAFSEEHRILAEKVREFVHESRMPDHGTLARELPDHVATIQDTLSYLEADAVIENRANQLLNHAKRRLLQSAAAYCQSAAEGTTNLDIALEQTFGQLADIYSGGVEMEDAADVVDRVEADYNRKREQGTSLTGVPTGMPEIDQATGGMQLGELHVLAARTGHGKSALSVNYIAPYAAQLGYPVLLIAHEMPSDTYILRMAAAIAGVDFNVARNGNLRLPTDERFRNALHKIKYEWPIKFLNAHSTNPSELMANVMSWRQAQGKPGLVIVDHLQNESIPGWRGQRHEMFAHISAQWKSCFRISGSAGIIIAQLNRAAAGQPPRIEHLRDSGAIEQDAYAVITLYRPGVDDSDDVANQARVALPKNRNGALAYSHLHFTGYSMGFRPWIVGEDREEKESDMLEREQQVVQNMTRGTDEKTDEMNY